MAEHWVDLHDVELWQSNRFTRFTPYLSILRQLVSGLRWLSKVKLLVLSRVHVRSTATPVKSSPPLLLCFALHCRRLRVLELQPLRRTARTVTRAWALRDDPLHAETVISAPSLINLSSCSSFHPVDRSQRQVRRNRDGCTAGVAGVVSGDCASLPGAGRARCARSCSKATRQVSASRRNRGLMLPIGLTHSSPCYVFGALLSSAG